MARLAQIVCTATVILFTAVSTTHADPISIVSGSVFIPTPSNIGPANLVGTPAFSFSGRTGLPGNVVGLFAQCAVPECQPGSIVNVNLDLSGASGFLGGAMAIGGDEYGVSDNVNSTADLLLHFDGSFVAPAMGPDRATVTTPFSLTGRAFALTSLGEFAHNDQLFGRGVTTVSLLPFNPQAGFDPSWTVDNVRFDFLQPTPEPATLLLIGTGTLLPIMRRLRRS